MNKPLTLFFLGVLTTIVAHSPRSANAGTDGGANLTTYQNSKNCFHAESVVTKIFACLDEYGQVTKIRLPSDHCGTKVMEPGREDQPVEPESFATDLLPFAPSSHNFSANASTNNSTNNSASKRGGRFAYVNRHKVKVELFCRLASDAR